MSVPWALWGVLAVVRDEFIQPTAAKWKLLYWVSRWPWYVWLITTLVIALVVLFEGAYRAIRDRDAAHAKALTAFHKRIAALEGARPRLVFGRGVVGERAAYYIRNDGSVTAINVRVTTTVPGLLFSAPADHPADGTNRKAFAYYKGRDVSDSIIEAAIESGALDDAERRLKDTGTFECQIPVLLKYESHDGRRYYDQYAVVLTLTRAEGEGGTTPWRLTVIFIHPQPGAPDAFAVHA